MLALAVLAPPLAAGVMLLTGSAYAAAALLVREIARHRGLGLGAVILLGAAIRLRPALKGRVTRSHPLL